MRAGRASGRVWYDAAADVWRVWAFDAARAMFLDRDFRFPEPPSLNDQTLPPSIAAAARQGRAAQVRWFALDSELHLQVRPVLAAALSGAAVAKLEASMRAKADATMAAALADPTALRDFCKGFPRDSQLDLFGVPPHARPAVLQSALVVAALFPHRKANPVRPWIAQASLMAVIEDLFDAPAPAGAVVLEAMQRAVAAGRLAHADAIAALSVVMTAGLETAGFALTGLIARLAGEADLRVRARSGGAALNALIEEELRASASPQIVGCFDHDLVLNESRIPAGSRILVDIKQANHDPARFDDPDRFIPDRNDADHIAFGAGVHVCVGRHFARLHLRVAAEAFLAAFPRLSQACAGEMAALAAGAPAAAPA